VKAMRSSKKNQFCRCVQSVGWLLEWKMYCFGIVTWSDFSPTVFCIPVVRSTQRAVQISKHVECSWCRWWCRM